MSARRLCALLVGTAAIACWADAPARTTVRDSAGVQIVENGATGAWTPATAWTVADTPSRSLGGDGTDSTTIFSLVRSAAKLGGDDYLLGVFRDSLDVEHVRMHRIIKPRIP